MSNETVRMDDKLPTVTQAKARKLVDLVQAGTPVKDAEKQCGVTVEQLRREGVLGTISSQLMKRVEDAGLKDKEKRKDLARAVLIEQMMQDEDRRAKIRAAERILSEDTPLVALQQNVSINDPEVIELLKTLRDEKEGESNG